MKTFAERLAWARIQAGFKSPQEAADRFGWNRNTYKSHDNGVRGGERGPKEQTVKKYARCFGVNWVWLFTGEGRPTAVKSVPTAQDATVGASSPQSFRIYQLEDSDRIQVEIGDLEKGFLRALRRGGTTAKEARAIVGVLIEALAELPSAHVVRRLTVLDHKPPELPGPALGDL